MSSNKRDNFIQAYHDLNIALISSMVIKSDYAPDAINKQLKLDYGSASVDNYDPGSWKYYMNLAGEYHPTDREMVITSLDTRDQILFSPGQLIRHTATAEAYRSGGRYYLSLLRDFPDQEALIHGILYPADKEACILAKEGSILSYNSSLVEINEKTLIIELEAYVKRLMARWYVGPYALTDEYYAADFFSKLGGLCLLEVLRLRRDRCKTSEVHSFHLREYLASHSGLDIYLKFLTREQALYIYRNIKYIQRNAGNSFMFTELIDKLLDVRGIPLTDYTVRQLQEETSDGYPVMQARRVYLTQSKSVGMEPYIPLTDLYDKELKTTSGNNRYFEVSEEVMTHSLATANSSVTQTKDLESAMVDLSGAVPDTMPTVFMRQWISMTHGNLYNVIVNFQDPITTEERSLISKDAIIYMAYLTLHNEGYVFDTLPPIENIKFRKHPRPPVDDLLRLIPSDFRYDWLRDLADDLVGAQPVLTDCYSVSAFYSMTIKIYDECLRHFYLTSATGDLMMRGVLEQMTNQLFSVAYWDFSDGENIEVWRDRLNLPEYNYTKEQANLIVKEVFERATGYRIDETNQIRFIQRALLNMFQDLSSYSIQIIREINDSEVFLMCMPELRVGVIDSISEDYVEIRQGLQINGIQGLGISNCEISEDSPVSDILITTDIDNSTVNEVSTVEDQILLVDREQNISILGRGDVATLTTSSLDPLTGVETADLATDTLSFSSFDSALKFAKFLGKL